ncbi:hypothetical protein Taro_001428, partial [Colocasia esculenta]|nr:hypothetical protein [Colocasia esculenta]
MMFKEMDVCGPAPSTCRYPLLLYCYLYLMRYWILGRHSNSYKMIKTNSGALMLMMKVLTQLTSTLSHLKILTVCHGRILHLLTLNLIVLKEFICQIKCQAYYLAHESHVPFPFECFGSSYWLLLLQSDDWTVPLFSIPRSTITENPFTSLLLCSFSPSDIMTNEMSTIIWCQNLAIEWLSAVETALLKGRHPLLNDVDITITPTKSIPMLEGRLSERGIRDRDKINSVCDSEMQNISSGYFLKLPNSNAASGFLMDPISTLLEKDDRAYQGKANDSETCEIDIVKDAEASQESDLANAGSRTDEGDSPLDGERSQVLATATVILNMLDVTMPGTLGDEQKKKVLTATEQGETFMKALQGAVPEDVRGKLMSAVSEIMQSQGNKINVCKLKKIGWIPNISSSKKSKIKEQSGDISTADGPHRNPFADYKKSGVNSQERIQGDSVSNHIGEHDAQDSKESSREKFSEASGHTKSKLEFEGKQNQSSEPEMISSSSETSEDTPNRRADDRHEDVHINLEASEPHFTEGKNVDARTNEKFVNPSINHEDSHVSDSSSVEHGRFQKEANDTQDNNNENVQNSKKIEEPSSNQSPGNPPSISVSQALDALTGFDDSTQMAVNSVFGVIENMIDHLERETGKNDSEERKDSILDSGDMSKESLANNDHKFNN